MCDEFGFHHKLMRSKIYPEKINIFVWKDKKNNSSISEPPSYQDLISWDSKRNFSGSVTFESVRFDSEPLYWDIIYDRLYTMDDIELSFISQKVSYVIDLCFYFLSII
jgi:hypothetical protein